MVFSSDPAKLCVLAPRQGQWKVREKCLRSYPCVIIQDNADCVLFPTRIFDSVTVRANQARDTEPSIPYYTWPFIP